MSIWTTGRPALQHVTFSPTIAPANNSACVSQATLALVWNHLGRRKRT